MPDIGVTAAVRDDSDDVLMTYWRLGPILWVFLGTCSPGRLLPDVSTADGRNEQTEA
jgi:hypothetical protein